MSSNIEQEQHCLNIKILCDYLRTDILFVDDFPGKNHYLSELKKLKKIANEKYWSL